MIKKMFRKILLFLRVTLKVLFLVWLNVWFIDNELTNVKLY